MVAAVERRLAGEFRVSIQKSPRSADEIRKLTAWQREQLASALDVTTALEGTGRDYNRLDPTDQSYYISEELRSIDLQHTSGFQPHFWTPLMRSYIERATR